jgi:recombination protein RecA
VVEFQQVRPVFGPGGDVLGLRVRATVAKNRLAAPGGQAELEIQSGRGIRRAAEVLELGLGLGLVERCAQGLVWREPTGAWVFLGRGTVAAQAELESDPELIADLREAIEQLDLDLRAVQGPRSQVQRVGPGTGI